MPNDAEPQPERPRLARAVTSVLVDVDADRVLEALTSPDLLSTWLGPWSFADGHERVTTDDGVIRRVERLVPDHDGQVAWRWSPVDGAEWSEVRFAVTSEAGGTRLTVTETLPTGVGATASTNGPSAAVTAPAVPWLGCLMALGAVLAVGSLVAA